MTDPIYRFKGRYIDIDPEGYYHPRWDKAKAISVLAGTKTEATGKAFAMLGNAPKYRQWSLIWDSVDEEQQPPTSTTEETQ